MPGMLQLPKPEWTDADVNEARRRGKKVALEHHDVSDDPLTFTVEDAAALMEREGLFADGSASRRAAMTYELHDFAHRFAAELREVSA